MRVYLVTYNTATAPCLEAYADKVKAQARHRQLNDENYEFYACIDSVEVQA